MRETLHIRLREPGSEGPVAYALTAAEPPVSVFVREALLDEVLAQADHRRIVLYAPSHDVRLLSASVPAKQAGKALLAVPYALEDQFAEDVETLHFAIASQAEANGEWPVAVVAAAHMRDWLAPLLARGLVPDALIPESLALPWREDGRWTALAEPGHMTVRTGAYAGFGCLAEDLEMFLSLSEGETRRSLRILISKGVDTDFTRLERDVELLPGLDHPLEAFARNFRPALSISLLQGPYALRRGYARQWQVWKLVAGLAAISFVLGAFGNGIAALKLRHQAEAQHAANEERFRQLFPAEQRIIDLRAQAEQQFNLVQGASKGAGMLALVDQLADGLKAAPTLQVQGMQFREGALFLSLTGSNLSALDQLRAHFAGGHGARLDVQSANSGEGGLQIRIKLSPA